MKTTSVQTGRDRTGQVVLVIAASIRPMVCHFLVHTMSGNMEHIRIFDIFQNNNVQLFMCTYTVHILKFILTHQRGPMNSVVGGVVMTGSVSHGSISSHRPIVMFKSGCLVYVCLFACMYARLSVYTYMQALRIDVCACVIVCVPTCLCECGYVCRSFQFSLGRSGSRRRCCTCSCSRREPSLRPAAHTPHRQRPNAGSHCWRRSRNSDQRPERWRWLSPVSHRGHTH